MKYFMALCILLFVMVMLFVPALVAATPVVAPDQTTGELITGFLMDWGVPAVIIAPLTAIILWAMGLLRFKKTTGEG